MIAYFGEDKYDVLFDVDHRGLHVLLSNKFETRKTNVQEYEILKSRDTVNVNEIIVINHSENQGNVDALISAGVINGKATRYIEVGYIKYGVYQLTKKAIAEIYRQNNLMQKTG